MNGPRIGSLFSGYGGLEMGVQATLGGTTAWVSDIDPGACRILAHRYPDIPNLGDVTAVNWANVEPVDILTGGFPCQDVSHAGARAGMGPGTRSGLWSRMADAIDHLRPSLVIAENVRGLLSAEAASDVEPCPWCLGDGPCEPPLRALGAVLADLAELGYDASWYGLRAADVGAPHGRFRVFVLAWPTGDAAGIGREAGIGLDGRGDPGQWREASPRPRDADRVLASNAAGARRGGAEVTRGDCSDEGRRTRRVELERVGGARLSLADTDSVGSVRAGGARRWGTGPADSRGHASTDTDSTGLEGAQPAAGRVVPHGSTPADAHGTAGGRLGEGSVTPGPAEGTLREARRGTGRGGGAPTADSDGPAAWGPYGPAVRRWERRLGRPAPAPTEPGSKGQPRLSPAFVEFLMGLPAGWVTDVPGLSRNDQLKALGNGVVPQQAATAVRFMLARLAEEHRWAA